MAEADRIREQIRAMRTQRESMTLLEYLTALKTLDDQLAQATAQEVA